MDVNQILAEISQQGVQLSVEGEQLRVRTPKGVLTPQLQELLIEHKAELLRLLRLNSSGIDEPNLPKIVPAPEQRYQPFPLTDIQQAYWLGRRQTFQLGNVATHFYLEIDNNGVDLKQLSTAWQQLIERHEMLRTVVLPTGEQLILKEVPPYKIEVLDLRQVTTQEQDAQLQVIRDRMSHQILSTDEWPLFEIRATLFSEGKTRLHISIDLLIADIGSTMLLFKEWQELYHNSNLALSPLELSFRDYVLAEQALKNSQEYRAACEYWFNRLDTLPPAPELPLTGNSNSLSQPRFVHRSFRLDKQSWQGLKQRAMQAGLTPSGVLLAAFADVLRIWSKSPKFTINLTLFNRLPLHPQINDIVGDFTSTILLAVDLSTPESFTVQAQQIQQQLWQDLDRAYVGGVQLLRELSRRQGRSPGGIMPVVFTSALSLGKLAPDMGGLSQFGEVTYSISQTPQVWLDHQVFEQDGALLFNWDAVEELFPEGLLDSMFEAYCSWLKKLATSDSAWEEEERFLLPSAQLAQRIAANNTAAPISEQTLHALFVQQVQARAESVALIASERTLTYWELYERANQVGRLLRNMGAVPNELVAVVMEKGWEQVVAILGILMSGAAYVPIDSGLPTERCWQLLKQGKVKLVLTQPWLNQTLEWPTGVQVLCLDDVKLMSTDTSPLTPVETSKDLAYVIYTSGSSGAPKGVKIDHQGAVNTILDINKRFKVGSEDRVLALSALNFDLSVYDIFGILAAGGTLVMPSAGQIQNPAHWADLLVSERVTLWNSVPALMQMLVEHLLEHSNKCSSYLRLVLLSGDWLPLNLPEQIKALCPDVEVVSLGGATEASIWSIFYPIEDMVDPSWKSIPYGKPLQNQRFYIFDELMQPTPVWVPGQLYIAGVGLAQGYWQDEEKTKASFIFHEKTQERLYKTGDIGQYLPDGNIEFLGREDFQVKINGYRIELGEIEAALQQHSLIKHAVVCAVGSQQGQKQLVGYVVPHLKTTQASVDTEKLETTQLRKYLQQKLPEYMVPINYVFLDSLPLNSNGKVDRKAVILQKPLSFTRETPYVAPSNPTEEALVKIWSRILERNSIGVNDNFFDLGGESLLGFQIVSAIQKAFQVEISLADFYLEPTITGLALAIEELIIDQLLAESEEN